MFALRCLFYLWAVSVWLGSKCWVSSTHPNSRRKKASLNEAFSRRVHLVDGPMCAGGLVLHHRQCAGDDTVEDGWGIEDADAATDAHSQRHD